MYAMEFLHKPYHYIIDFEEHGLVCDGTDAPTTESDMGKILGKTFEYRVT